MAGLSSIYGFLISFSTGLSYFLSGQWIVTDSEAEGYYVSQLYYSSDVDRQNLARYILEPHDHDSETDELLKRKADPKEALMRRYRALFPQ